MRTGAGAAVGVVTEGVDVHAALGVGIVAGDVPGDGRGRGLGVLGEGDGALDGGVTAENCDCVSWSVSQPVGSPRQLRCCGCRVLFFLGKRKGVKGVHVLSRDE